jgi:hypothetical protein
VHLRSIALSALLTSCLVASLPAQLKPASRWALGLGFSHLSASGGAFSDVGFGVMGLYSPMLTEKVGLEVEGRALVTGGGSVATPDCVAAPGVICDERTLMPSEVIGIDARMAWVPDPRIRLSAGPALAWAPDAVGPGSEPTLGGSAGLALSPFGGRGLSLELRGTRFFSSLAEVDWVFGTALSWRF